MLIESGVVAHVVVVIAAHRVKNHAFEQFNLVLKWCANQTQLPGKTRVAWYACNAGLRGSREFGLKQTGCAYTQGSLCFESIKAKYTHCSMGSIFFVVVGAGKAHAAVPTPALRKMLQHRNVGSVAWHQWFDQPILSLRILHRGFRPCATQAGCLLQTDTQPGINRWLACSHGL